MLGGWRGTVFMNSCRASVMAACFFAGTAGLLQLATGPAGAQVQPQQPAAGSPWDQQPQPAPWPGQAPQGAQGLQGLPGMQGPQQGPSPQQQQQQQACVEEFGKLRDVAQKRAMAIRTASARKAQAKEACGLFNAFSDAEVKMIKFAGSNANKCGIPPEIVKTLTQNHVKTGEIRARVCQAAAGPMPSAAPSLSDALSAPVPDASNIKTGRGTGTYDTLTGTPLGK
jgi:hypothetical protein